MHSALRFASAPRRAVAIRVADDAPPRTLIWLASFILLSTALAGLEIRSEALTVRSLSPSMGRSGAAEPQFFVPMVAASGATLGHVKD